MSSISMRQNGDKAQIRPMYSNFSRHKHRRGGGFYFTVSNRGGPKVAMNAHGAQAVADNWPGIAGELVLERITEDRWEVYAVNDRSADDKYPLQCTQWDQKSKQFRELDWQPGQSLMGLEFRADGS